VPPWDVFDGAWRDELVHVHCVPAGIVLPVCRHWRRIEVPGGHVPGQRVGNVVRAVWPWLLLQRSRAHDAVRPMPGRLGMQLDYVDSAHALPCGHLPGLARRLFVCELRPRRVLERHGPHHGLRPVPGRLLLRLATDCVARTVPRGLLLALNGRDQFCPLQPVPAGHVRVFERHDRARRGGSTLAHAALLRHVPALRRRLLLSRNGDGALGAADGVPGRIFLARDRCYFGRDVPQLHEG
jgi:hypothetical protein